MKDDTGNDSSSSIEETDYEIIPTIYKTDSTVKEGLMSGNCQNQSDQGGRINSINFEHSSKEHNVEILTATHQAKSLPLDKRVISGTPQSVIASKIIQCRENENYEDSAEENQIVNKNVRKKNIRKFEEKKQGKKEIKSQDGKTSLVKQKKVDDITSSDNYTEGYKKSYTSASLTSSEVIISKSQNDDITSLDNHTESYKKSYISPTLTSSEVIISKNQNKKNTNVMQKESEDALSLYKPMEHSEENVMSTSKPESISYDKNMKRLSIGGHLLVKQKKVDDISSFDNQTESNKKSDQTACSTLNEEEISNLSQSVIENCIQNAVNKPEKKKTLASKTIIKSRSSILLDDMLNMDTTPGRKKKKGNEKYISPNEIHLKNKFSMCKKSGSCKNVTSKNKKNLKVGENIVNIFEEKTHMQVGNKKSIKVQLIESYKSLSLKTPKVIYSANVVCLSKPESEDKNVKPLSIESHMLAPSSTSMKGNSDLEHSVCFNMIKKVIDLKYSWLISQRDIENPPMQVLKPVQNIPMCFTSPSEYIEAFSPVVLLSLWESMFKEYKNNKKFEIIITDQKENVDFDMIEYQCESVSASYTPLEGDILVMHMSDESRTDDSLIGYVLNNSVFKFSKGESMAHFVVLANFILEKNKPIKSSLIFNAKRSFDLLKAVCFLDSPLGKIILKPQRSDVCLTEHTHLQPHTSFQQLLEMMQTPPNSSKIILLREFGNAVDLAEFINSLISSFVQKEKILIILNSSNVTAVEKYFESNNARDPQKLIKFIRLPNLNQTHMASFENCNGVICTVQEWYTPLLALLKEKIFSYCIVDSSNRFFELEMLQMLLFGVEKLFLIEDPCSFNHGHLSLNCKSHVSLFDRLCLYIQSEFRTHPVHRVVRKVKC